MTFAEALESSQRLAVKLRQLGLTPGDRLAVMLPNGLPFVVAVLAGIMAGAIVVPVDPRLRASSLAHIAGDCSPRAAVCTPEAAERLDELDPSDRPTIVLISNANDPLERLLAGVGGNLDNTDGDDNSVVTITYTSGSTGVPKGVMHSHRSWLAGADYTARHFHLVPPCAILIPLGLYHGYAFRHLLAYLLSGGTVIVTDGLMDGLERLDRDRPEALLLVPDACAILLHGFRSCLSDCRDFLKLISVGTAALSDDLLGQLRDALPDVDIHLPYGLTEARVGFLQPDDRAEGRRLTSTAPTLDVRVVDPAGRDVGPGETGEILIHGEGLMVGYWGSADQQRQDLAQFGFRTGDRGRVNDCGEITLEGRLDEILNIGGRKVHPLEVETVLNQHPAVAESAVTTAPDPAGITEVRLEAVVVLRPGASASERILLDHCREHLEPHKVPAVFFYVDLLPKTATGKILRAPSRNVEDPT